MKTRAKGLVGAGAYAMQAYGLPRMAPALELVALAVPKSLPRIRHLLRGGIETRASGVPVRITVRQPDDSHAPLVAAAIRHARRVEGISIRVVPLPYLTAMVFGELRTREPITDELHALMNILTKAECAEARRLVRRHLSSYGERSFDERILACGYVPRRLRVYATDSYQVVIAKDDHGWWVAKAPELSGAISQGRTEASARKNLASGIQDLLQAYDVRPGRGDAPT